MELQKHLGEFDASGIALFAISYDSVEVLSGFADEYGIEFPILADVGSSVIREFGILNTLIKPHEEEFYGIPFPGTFLVDADGQVVEKFFNREYQVRETSATVLRSGFHVPVDLSMMAHDETERVGLRLSAELTAAELHNRQHADIYVTLNLDDGLHVYGESVPDGYVATEVRASGTEGLEFGAAQFPATKPFQIEDLNETFQVLDGEVQIVVPVVSTIREVGTAAVDIEVTYQACDDTTCFLPRTEKLHLEFPTGPAMRRSETSSVST